MDSGGLEMGLHTTNERHHPPRFEALESFESNDDENKEAMDD